MCEFYALQRTFAKRYDSESCRIQPFFMPTNLAMDSQPIKLGGVQLLPDPNYRVIDKVGMPHVTKFIAVKLAPYDTSDLDWIKLLPLNRRELLHGACDFPYPPDCEPGARTHGYRIRASVNVEMVPPFSYLHWGRVASEKNPRGWVSGEQEFHFGDLDECAVHTLSHECFHFLSASGQLAERNTEANANWWADGWLDAFRIHAADGPRPGG